jgi:hypothetical protein
MKKYIALLKGERGSIESAMVLIPLLVLFLIGMQLATAVHIRNMARMTVQDDATTRAISGDFSDADQFIHVESSGDGQNLDILVTRRRNSLTNLLPGFLSDAASNREVDVYGLAIVENQR